MGTMSRHMKEKELPSHDLCMGKRERVTDNLKTSEWTTGWQVVSCAEVENTRGGTDNSGQEAPISVPCPLCEDTWVPILGLSPLVSPAHPENHLTEMDPQRPKQEKVATYFSQTL